MISEIFSEDGALAKALTHLGRKVHLREPQRLYAEIAANAINARKPGFLDAETGVGKSLGYLVPTMTEAFKDGAGPLVVISTATVALQRQLLHEDVPVASQVAKDVLGYSPKVAMRVGRDQMIDPHRLDIAISELATPADRELAADISAWAHAKVSAEELPLRADLMEMFAARLVDQKAWLAPAFLGLADGQGEIGRLYDRLLQECQSADVLIINHHLLAVNLLHPFLWDAARPVYLVVDEADRLPNIIETVNRRVLPLHLLTANVASFSHSDDAKTAVEALSSEVMLHFENAWRTSNGGVVPTSKLDGSEKAVLRLKMKTASVALEMLLKRLHTDGTGRRLEVRERVSELDHYRYELEKLVEEAETPNGQALLYYSPVRRYPGIASVQSGKARMIASRLWVKTPFDMKALIFTSATLATMASQSDSQDAKRAMTPFIVECGFNIADIPQASCALIAPKSFGRMSFVRPPLDAPPAFMDEADEGEGYVLRPEAIALWREMIVAATSEGGRTLVLLPSYKDVAALAELLVELGDQVIVQEAGVPTNAAVSRFLSRPDSIWLSAAAWEGVSLPGAIAHIVIPRIPVRPSSLEDSVVERYFAEMGKASKGPGFVFAKKMASTRRRLRQGIGRGIRSSDDSVKIWIGDRRWPLTQEEVDRELLDQPTKWSSTLLNAVPKRFRKTLETSPRFRG